MKLRKFDIIMCFLVLIMPGAVAQTTWKAPGYKAETFRRVMVLARVTEDAARRQLEDFTVKFLKDKGITAIPAYSQVQPADLVSREVFLKKADSLQVDALLVYAVEGAEKVAQHKPTVSVGVGFGMYGGFVGASAPVAGGTKMVTQVELSANFYTRSSQDKQWIMQLSAILDKGTDELAYTLSKSTVKAMFRDKLFIMP